VDKKSPPFDILTRIAPVAGLARGPDVLVVHPSLPVTTVAEIFAYAKARPRRLNMGTPGVAATGHMAGELCGGAAPFHGRSVCGILNENR
jgi:tripartite-type tricarboxylate transporter receptor subunit TctC